jgi:hypothetical protein
MPEGATVSRNGTVTWIAKKKKRTGKLSKTGKVSLQVDTWTAQFTDETGKIRKVPTKTTCRSQAEKLLARYEKDVERIRTGVVSRAELEKAEASQVTLDEALERMKTKMHANGNTPLHICSTIKQIKEVLDYSGIVTLADIRRESVERWIADERQRKVRSAQTINIYVASLKSFVQYLVDIEVLSRHTLKLIRKLNVELDRRKIRRALTQDEVNRLLQATASSKSMAAGLPEERVLIYRDRKSVV